jgi:hypothetical protein
MAIAIEDIARELKVAPGTLVRQSVLAYIAQQERLARADISDLADRYRVATVSELREAVSRGQVYGHPAWEDAIEWEHLEAYLGQLKELRSRVRSSAAPVGSSDAPAI